MLNKIHLLGHVGKDPEVRKVNDRSVANFSLATSETYKKNGEKVTNTEWHNIVIWGRLAEIVESYVKKGALLYLEGKVVTRSWEKDGVTKYTTECVCNQMTMVGKSSNGQAVESNTNEETDDLPF